MSDHANEDDAYKLLLAAQVTVSLESFAKDTPPWPPYRDFRISPLQVISPPILRISE